MEELTDFQSEIIARKIMKIIQSDNGSSDLWNINEYPKEWVNKISKSCKLFFGRNFELNTDDIIKKIATGNQETNELEFGKLIGWTELTRMLDDYFENMPLVPKKKK
jgi:hypothetical protein